MTFSDWLNKTMMTSFRSFCITVIASIILVACMALASALLLDRSSTQTWTSKDAGVRAEGRTTETTRQNHGKDIVTAIFTFLTAVIVTNAASQYGDRTTSKEHTLAKGQVAAALLTAGNGHTKEQPIVQVERADEVNVQHGKKPAPLADLPDMIGVDKHEWADDRADAGIL